MDYGLAVSVAALGLATASYFRNNYRAKDMTDCITRLVALETKMDLFWSVVESQMARVLHSPHTPDLDALLEKIQDGHILSLEELDDLRLHLGAIISDPETTKGERVGATLLLAALEVRYPKNPIPGVDKS